MHYMVEFVRWRETTSADAEVVGWLDGPFGSKDEAFAHAEPLFPQFRLKGATAFRVFEADEATAPFPSGTTAFVKI